MLLTRQYLEVDVLTEARKRIEFIFDEFERICVSFSGGKDSTVMMHLVMDEAVKRNRTVGVLFIDWECQFKMTEDHVAAMYELYKDNIDPYWLCIPLVTDNSFSQIEPEFTAWDDTKKDVWVRKKHKISIKDGHHFPFYEENMTFEDFAPLFSEWYAQGKGASLVGIRTQEALNRFRAVTMVKENYKCKPWTTHVGKGAWNIYPIYDWQTDDIWLYLGKYNKCYNPLYDRMYHAGIPKGNMRIDEPFGDTQRHTLWLYQVVEPELWAKFVARISGVNTAALYCKEKGNILGNRDLNLPEGHTWQSFANFILDTMPASTAEHYKNKIAVYLKWYRDRDYEDGIPDFADISLENKGLVPSWRKICKTLLRNDYWCRWLGFSPTKSSAYKKYQDLMKRRRAEWDIYGDKEKAG